MTENKFLYLITDQDGKFFYEEDGLVQRQGQFRALQHSPDGFQDQSIEYKRDSRWHGVFRNFSFPLGFVLDGKNIINYIRYKLGYEFRAFLHILILDFFINETEYGFGYKKYYKGEFDLTTVNKSENKIEVSLLDGGVEAMMRANENTQYTISLDKEDTCKVLNDGIRLVNTAQYLVSDGVGVDLNYTIGSHIADLQIVTKETEDIGSVKNATRTSVTNSNTAINSTNEWFFQATVDFTLSFEYDFVLNVTKLVTGVSVDPSLQLFVVIRPIAENNVAERQAILFQRNMPLVQFGGSFHIQGTANLEVKKGESVYFVTYMTTSGATGDAQFDFKYEGERFLKFQYYYVHPTTETIGYRLSTLFEKLISKVTDGKYGADTTFLKRKKQYFITSGDAIRQIEGASIKISLSDLWQFIWANEDVYMGITIKDNKRVVIIDELKYQYQLPGAIIYNPVTQQPVNNPILNALNKYTDLGNVSNCETETNKDVLFNTIKVGSATQNYEDTNGRTEFNAFQYWSAPVVRSKNQLDLSTGNIRCDAIGIEYVRINFGGKTTTDANSDNQTFAMYTEQAPFKTVDGVDVYRLDRSETIVGVVSPDTHFNAFFSPKHMLNRKKRYLKSCLNGLSGDLKITMAEKNADVSFNGVTERGSMKLSDLGDPYFTPDLIKFDTPQPLNLIELQNSGDLKRNCFKITWNERDYYGFLHTVSIQPWMNETQTITLISSPKNDLSTI